MILALAPVAGLVAAASMGVPAGTSPVILVENPAPPPLPAAATVAPDPEPAATPAAAARHAPGDPLERLNRRVFRGHERFDRAVFRPAAIGYTHILPRPLRTALRNFFSNLGEPVIALNFLLQRKPGKAIETLGRFAVNTTLGLAGTVDLAKSPGVRLPHRPNGFADTLGFYGVKPGPYFFLPLFGPTTLRDFLGGQGDGLILPIAIGEPFDRIDYQVVKGVTTGLDTRAEADDDLKALNAGAVDRYATLRSVYLQNRAGEIAHLKGTRTAAAPPAPELGEPLADPAGTHTPPPKPDSGASQLSDPLADPASTQAPPSPKLESGAPELSDPLTDPAAPKP
ncbi:VacJ family lipoprotein [Sphingomonas sp. CROZ-RG-20F-R02-07]|uniref:MlaA family lipoprotein n=1 Tax=Sphingomonas sp. CROZ-RG-20F-R02-07 TaxID=2914832 RepID=UPI001F56F779|nr:VacJ family lipoprotein [Sphingomonas sp. CROZ-RG-20F-R02-07]